MKRACRILSLTLLLASVALAQTRTQQTQPAEKLNKQQLLTLVATAKTPAEHMRLAEYYSAKAKDFAAQSQEHEQMATQYKKNPLISSSKWATGTIGHCEYFAKTYKEMAAKMQELAELHEQMAHAAALH